MDPSITEFLEKFSPEVREICLNLRSLVYRLAPDANEIVYTGWGNIQFYFANKPKSHFCAINPLKGRVDFFFMRATELPDPAGLLQGTGKKLRHVKINSNDQVDNPALRELILAAVDLARSDK